MWHCKLTFQINYTCGIIYLLNCPLQLNRVKAVEKEKDELEPVKNEAVEFLTMENDIVKKKNLLYQKYQ